LKVSQTILPRKMNLDVEERLMKETECRYKLNLRHGNTSGPKEGVGQGILSMAMLKNPFKDSGDVEIGSYEDIQSQATFYFMYNPNPDNHKIIRYIPQGDSYQFDLVVKHRYLNFQLNCKISHVDMIGGILKWTDGFFGSFINSNFNPPRGVDVEMAIAFYKLYYGSKKRELAYMAHAYDITHNLEQYGLTAYVFKGTQQWALYDKVVTWVNEGVVYGERLKPATGYGVIQALGQINGLNYIVTGRIWDVSGAGAITGYILPYYPKMYYGIDFQVLSALKYPPSRQPICSYDSDPAHNTKDVQGALFQFSYRWTYVNNETTVWSPISNIPLPSVYNMLDILSNLFDNADNMIKVKFDTGPMEVVSIELAFREGNKGLWNIFRTIYKYDEGGNMVLGMNSDIQTTYYFYNDDLCTVIDAKDDVNQVLRPYDNVPQVAGRQALIEKNRMLYADNTENYDNLDINVSLIPKRTALNFNNYTKDFLEFLSQVGPNGKIWDGRPGDWTPFFSGINVDLPDGIPVGVIVCVDLYRYLFNGVNWPSDWNSPAGPGYPPYNHEFLGNGGVSSDLSNCQLFTVYYKTQPGDTTASVVAYLLTQINNLWPQYNYPGPNPQVPGNYPIAWADPIYHRRLRIHRFTWEQYYGTGIEGDYYGNWWGIQKMHVYAVNSLVDIGFKSGATPLFALHYFDEGMRTGGANENATSKIYLPALTEISQSLDPTKQYIYKMGFEIYHKPPVWARYYGWLLIPGLKWWLQFHVMPGEISTDSVYTYIELNDSIQKMANRFPNSTIRNYDWQKGDRMRILYRQSSLGDDGTYKLCDQFIDVEILGTTYTDVTNPYTPPSGPDIYQWDLSSKDQAPILDEKGNKVADLGKLKLIVPLMTQVYTGWQNIIVQVYTPQESNLATLGIYNQFDKILPILDAHTPNCRHGKGDGPLATDQSVNLSTPASGVFTQGDCYIRTRITGSSNYLVEDPAYCDFFESSDISIGKVNVVNRAMKRKEYIAAWRFSLLYIQDSLVNGLSTFISGNSGEVSEKNDKIYGMREVGDVLRILQKNQPISIFIGKTSLKQADGGSVMALSDAVIGGLMRHPEILGTVFPESMASSALHTYFFDIFNGVYCRWASNGIKQIVGKDSETGWDFGMETYFSEKSKALLASGIENVNVFSVYEKEYKSIIVTFVDRVNPSNNDTVVFHEPTDTWDFFASYIPDHYATNGLVLTSSIGGEIWKHNVGPDKNKFYGVRYPAIVTVIGNKGPDKAKVWNALKIFSYQMWGAGNTGDISVATEGGVMRSRLNSSLFKTREGVQKAAYLMDMFTHGKESLRDLLTGRKLRGHAISNKLQCDDPDVELFGVEINGTISE
jgi:hypothetical protein